MQSQLEQSIPKKAHQEVVSKMQKTIDNLTEQFRAAEKRALLKRGIELWTRTELGTIFEAPRPLAKIN